jgi:peroxiredoxin
VTETRPAFEHRRERHGLIGPFTGRQLGVGLVVVVVAVVGLVIATTPLGTVGGDPGPVDPKATPFIIGPAVEGLRPGDLAPEFDATLASGSTFQLTDLNGAPVSLASLRGSGVWVNFFATWCPPCQAETPVVRDLADRYASQGLKVVAVSVQEASPQVVAQYVAKYQLGYTVGFDAAGNVFHKYRVYALPTQFFIAPDGRIRDVVQRPLTQIEAQREIEAILPGARASVPPAASAPAPTSPASAPPPSSAAGYSGS